MLNKNTKKILILIAVLVGIFFLGKYTMITMLLDKEYTQPLIEGFGVYASLIYIGLYIVATIFFLPATPISLLGGALFGNIMGTAYIVIGATIGATLAFLFARFLGKGYIEKLLKDKFKGLQKFDKKLEENGFVTMLFLRLVPLFPFNGLNFALGLTKIKFKDYVLGTLIGIMPGSFVIASIGNNLDVKSPTFYLFVAVFILMALIPTIYKKIKGKK